MDVLNPESKEEMMKESAEKKLEIDFDLSRIPHYVKNIKILFFTLHD